MRALPGTWLNVTDGRVVSAEAKSWINVHRRSLAAGNGRVNPSDHSDHKRNETVSKLRDSAVGAEVEHGSIPVNYSNSIDALMFGEKMVLG